jgi:hypothetical protein
MPLDQVADCLGVCRPSGAEAGQNDRPACCGEDGVDTIAIGVM